MILDIVFLLIAIIFILLGLKNGFIKEVLRLLSLIITVFLSAKVLEIARSFYDFKIQNKYILYLISFIITYIVVTIIFSIFSNFLDKTNFGIINKILGGVLGLVKASLLIFVIFVSCLFLSEGSKPLRKEFKESKSVKYISIYLSKYNDFFPEFIKKRLDEYRKDEVFKEYKQQILKEFSKGVF